MVVYGVSATGGTVVSPRTGTTRGVLPGYQPTRVLPTDGAPTGASALRTLILGVRPRTPAWSLTPALTPGYPGCRLTRLLEQTVSLSVPEKCH